MKLIASMWTIPIALCLLGAAFADELTTSGDAKGLRFSAASGADRVLVSGALRFFLKARKALALSAINRLTYGALIAPGPK